MYLILEIDWDGLQEYHVDLWTGSNTQGGGGDQVTCEDNLPGGQLTIINDAPDGLPVDTTELYDVSSNKCNSGTTYPVGDASSLCSGGSSGAPSGGSSVSQPQPSQSQSSQPQPSQSGPSQSPTVSVTANSLSTTLATVATTSSAGGGRGHGHESSTSTSAPVSSSTAEATCTWPGHCLGLSPLALYDFQAFANSTTRRSLPNIQ